MLTSDQCKLAREKFDASHAYTTSIQEVMKAAPNYKGKFEKLMAVEYRTSYNVTVNVLLENLSVMQPPRAKDLKDYLDGKVKKMLGHSTKIEAAAKKVAEVLSPMTAKAYEAENLFGWMEISYVSLRAKEGVTGASTSNEKEGNQGQFSEFHQKLYNFLEAVKTGEAALKTNLKKVADKELSKILLLLHDELINVPSELIAKAGFVVKDENEKGKGKEKSPAKK